MEWSLHNILYTLAPLCSRWVPIRFSTRGYLLHRMAMQWWPREGSETIIFINHHHLYRQALSFSLQRLSTMPGRAKPAILQCREARAKSDQLMKEALEAYRKIGKAMFYLYAVSFWATLATIVAGILAVCSRWGSLLTWILAFVG